MSVGEVVALMREGIMEIFILVAPVLGAALVIGLIVSILQAATSIQEQTLTFVPKLIAIFGMVALLGGWMFTRVAEYTTRLFNMIGGITR